MTRAKYEARGALPTARALRRLLQELFDESLRQMELLDGEDFDTLEDTLARKDLLMQMLPVALDAARAHGWELHDPSTLPATGLCSPVLKEAAALSARLQAHEKYCLSQMLARRNRIGEHLTVLLGRRNAAAGYRVPLARGKTIDTAS